MISIFKSKGKPLQANNHLLWTSCTAAGFAIALAACGGGGGGGKGQNDASSGQNQNNNNLSSSATYLGPISGFGSVIVNGTKFDDNSAKVTLDDDSASSTNELRLGMVVEIKGERNSSGTSGKAVSISGSSYAKGPITDVDIAANQINILGLRVNITRTTVFDGVAGLAFLEPNDFIEVHGLSDSAGNVKATRIEKKDPNDEIRLVGIVKKDKNANANSFSLYGNTVNFADAKLEKMDNGIADGMHVRIKGQLVDTNLIVASKVRQVGLSASVKSGEQTEVQGIVTHFTSADFFEVNGLKVKVAANARREGTLALGAKVEVEGYINDGILVADKVELKKEDGEDAEDIQIKSAISSIDIAAKTLTLRNGTITAKWTGATEFDAKTLPQGASGLGVNKVVEVRGTIDGQVVALTRVKLED